MKFIFLIIPFTSTISLTQEALSQTADFFQPLEPRRSIQVIAHLGLRIADALGVTQEARLRHKTEVIKTFSRMAGLY